MAGEESQAEGQQQEQQGQAAEQQTSQAEGQQQAQAPAPGSTVNRNKHERDMAKLQEQLDAKDKELEGYKGLKAEFEAFKAEQESAKAEAALKAAGCHDTVAARARLNEFGGDIDKLKEAAPYLFTSTDASMSTGGSQKGAPGTDAPAKTIREGINQTIGAK